MTNIAIAGAGTIGSTHAESFRNLPGVQATWVVDPILERAEAVAKPLGARVAGDLDEALSDSTLDAVLVAVPTPLHRALTEQAAAAGKHVFCEKPIALTLADARAMTDACQRAGVRLMVGHVVRFFPEYARIQQLLAERAVGTVGVVRASRVNAYPHLGRSWYADYSQSGGPILDLMVHDLDTLRWYFGDVERVYARGLSDSPYNTKVDYALAILRFASGEVAHVETSWAHTSFRTAIEIDGSDGLIRHSSEETTALRLELTSPPEATVGVHVPRSPLAESPYQTEMRHFTDRLADGAPFLTDGDEATRSLAVALAVRESVRTGRAISFADGWPQLQESQ
jgi:UDP-N-acetylglucosamine 3-dehydrogenase